MRSQTRARALVLTICLALMAAAFGWVHPPVPAAALVRDDFNPPIFSTDDNGAIAIVGNSQLSCPTSTSGCDTARSGTSANNNSYAMSFLDTDGVAATSNSTSADVSLPSGSEVLYARLIWGARVTAASGGTAATGTPAVAKLRTPGQSAYTTVTASTVVQPSTTLDGNPYQASLDVTSTVRTAGNGTYWFADMAAGTGADRYAGWSLIIAYRNPSLPLRNLSIFEGFADISTSVGNTPVNTVVSGFLTPATGTVNATVGLLAWEGDAGTTGDTLKLNGTTLTDAQRPSNNTFDSRISTFGANNTDRNPNYLNNLGVDMGRVSANGVLPNGSTAATVQVNTTGDTIYLGALTTEIDLYTPSFVGVNKSVVDLNGNSPAKVGDTLEYRLSYTNSGQDFADSVVARDSLPANVTYVPGSLTVVSGPNAGTKTDAAGDDVGDYTAADRTVRVRLGTGATATAGGTVNVNTTTALTFRVTLDRASAGSTVTNGSFLDYHARTLNRDYTFTTNTVSTPVQEIADLAISKTSDPTSQNAGSQVGYTLTVTDNGPNAGTNVVTTDTLPAGLTYVSSSPPNGTTCSAAGQVVTCRTGSLANGTSLSIPIVAQIDGEAAFSTAVNQATVSADTADDVPSNNAATATTAITRSADLAVTKTGPATAVAGGQVTYGVTVRNNGPSTVSFATLTDTLPVGLTLVSVTPSQGSCADAGQPVTCPLGRIVAGGTATVQVVARVAASFTGTSVTNSASVTSQTPDANADNNSDAVTTTITRSADLSITKTASPTTVTAGTTSTFTLVATNNGPSDASDVVITDPAVTGLEALSASTTQGTCTTTAGTVRCPAGTVANGSSVRVTITARVPATRAAGTVTNTAAVTASTTDPGTGNNSASAELTVRSQADLVLTKTASPNPIQPGNPVTYTLRVTNNGPSQATGAAIVDSLPNDSTFVSGDAGCTAAGQTVTCAVGTLAVGASATRTVVALIPDSFPGTSLTNTARVTSDNDPDTGNNTASFVSSTNPQADLALTKTAPASVTAGGQVTFTLLVRNAGPSAATGVSVSDPLPAAVTNATATSTGGGTCTVTGQQVTCALGTLGNAATRTVTITGTVAAGTTATSLSNTATVTSTGPGDPTTSNNSATATSAITTSADVAVTLTAITPTVRAGDEVTYEVVARNNGPSTARNVVVSGLVPAGMQPVPGSSGGACTVSANTVSCAIGDLPAGASGTLRFRALVLPSTPAGPITATAYIGSATPDSVPANNSDPETITVVTAADLVATKTATPNPLVAGGSYLYTITAANRGPSDATAVTLVDTLPAGLGIDSVDPSAGTCSVTGQQVSCQTDRLAPDGVLTVRVRGSLADDLTGSLTNVATADSAVSDPDPSNDSATLTTPVTQSADLRLTKAVSPEPVPAGTSVTYTLTAVNVGPSEASAVVLADTMPDGLTVLANGVSGPDGTDCTVAADNGSFSCALGVLDPGASRSVTVTAFVPGDTDEGTRLTNTATLTSPTPTQNPGGRTASVTSTVVTSADLGVTKTGTQSSPIAGDTETYVLTVVNNGPSLARGAEVRDTLPDGVAYVSAVNPGGRCAEDDGTVTCSLGDLALGEIAVVQVRVSLDDDIAGRSVIDRATVASDTDDPVAANDTATLTQPVSAQSDLDVTKVLVGDPPVAGGRVTYRVTVVNHGPSLTRTVRADDVLPPGLGFVSATASDDGSCLFQPNAQTPQDDDVVECGWDRLAVADSVTATLTMTVPASATPGTDIVNTATAGSAAIDPTPATATVRTPITTSANLSTTKTLLSGAPVAGQEVRWQAVVHNDGPSVARDVRLADSAPAGITFLSAETARGGCTVVAAAVSCRLGDLAVGDSLTVTLSGRLDQDFAGSSLTNIATATSSTPDPDTTDNSGTTTTPTDALADLGLTKTATPSTPVAGQQISWTVSTVNAGPSVARSVVLTDQLPDGVTPVSQQLNVPGSCQTGATLVCRVASLAAGGSASVTIVARIDPGYASTAVTNTASVTSSVADPSPLDNTATVTSPVSASADLSVSKTGPDSAVAGGPISWQVTVSNTGPSDATAVVLTDALPAEVRGVSAAVAGGSCSVVDRTLTCPLGTLGPASDTVVTVNGTIAADVSASQLSNTAQVTSATPDPDTADRSATVATPLTRSADLTLTKTAATGTFTAGEQVGWTLDVVNHGPSQAVQVTVSDTVPDGVDDLATDQPGCSFTGRTLTCAVDGLAPGARLQIPVTGRLDAGYGGATIANTAAVTSSTPDPVPGNDSDTATTPVATSADLSVGKSVTSGPPVAGEPITYRVVVTNHGPSDAAGVVVTDPVPATVTAVVATSAAGACTVQEGQVRCALGSLANGAQAVVDVSGTVGQNFDETIVNTASVDADTDDPDSSDDTGTATATVGESADVGVSKTGPITATAGSVVSWTVTVTNDGPSTARDVRLTDALPAGLADVEVDAPDGTSCSTEVVCTLGSIADGEDVVLRVTGRIAADLRASTLVNNVAVSSATPDPDSTNATASSSTAITRSADLSITKSVDPGALTPGRAATYRIRVGNDGPSVATAVQVTDVLPDGLTLEPSGPSIDGGDCEVVGRTVRCTLASLTPGDTRTIVVPVLVDSAWTAPAITNTATVSAATPDPGAGNNTTELTSPLAPRADLTLHKTAPAQVLAGTAISWQLKLTNDGPSDAQDVVITDRLPAGVGPVYARSTLGTCTQDDRTVICVVGRVAAGGTVDVQLGTVGVLDPSYPPGSITNSASVDSPTADTAVDGDQPDADGRRDSADTVVRAAADVSVVKTALSSSAVAGGTVGWRVTVVNNGPSTAYDVVLSDPPVAGLDDVVLTPPAGVDCDDDGRCEVGTLQPGPDAALVFTVSARVPASFTGGSVVNTARADSSTDDPDPGDNRSSAPVIIGRSAGLSIVKTPDPEVAVPGGTVRWTILVHNAGPSVATNVQLSDPIPTGVRDVAVDAPAGVDCTTGATLTCTLDRLAVGTAADLELTLTGRLAADYTATSLSNVAAVTADTPDPDLSDNSSTATHRVVPSAGLSITKSGPADVVAGEDITYVLRVRNDGPSVARDVLITDPLPASIGSVRASAGDDDTVDCQVQASTLSCAVGDLADGGSVRIEVTGVVAADTAATTLTNVATVSSPTADPEPDDNTSTPVVTTVQTSADVSIVKSVDPSPVRAGEPATFRLEVRNVGPSVARAVSVTDAVPTDLTVTATRTTAGSCTTGQTVTCALGDLAVTPSADPVVIEITVDVADDVVADQIGNTATVLSTTSDPDRANNSSTVAGPAVARADLSITKTADVDAVRTGEQITWTLRARNDGPATARSVVLTDALPEVADATAIQPSTGSCSPLDVRPVTCSLGNLAPDGTATLTITATIDPTAAGNEILNAASISAATTDPDPSDNVVQRATPLRAEADLRLTKTADRDSVVAGEDLGWTLTVTNTGSGVARSVVVTDPLPAQVSAVAPAGCALTLGTISCPVAELAPGASATFVITGSVSASTTGSVSNTATVTAETADPDTDDNSATSTTPVVASADLAVTKTADATTVTVGDEIGYTITVTNNGPSDATGVRVQEAWPEAVQLIGDDPSQGSYDPATDSWTVGVLPAGATARLVLTGRVGDDGEITNAVTVAGDGCRVAGDAVAADAVTAEEVTAASCDPNPANDRAAATITADQAPAEGGSGSGGSGSGGSSSSGGRLPNTGGIGLGWLVGGVALLAAGAGLLVPGRRRRRRS